MWADDSFRGQAGVRNKSTLWLAGLFHECHDMTLMDRYGRQSRQGRAVKVFQAQLNDAAKLHPLINISQGFQERTSGATREEQGIGEAKTLTS